MRRAFGILFISSLFSSPVSGQNASPPAAPPGKTEKCTVAGMVVRKGSNEPIHFAHITLANVGDEQKSFHDTTASDGRFSFKDVPPGDYRVTVTRNGFVTESYGARHPMDPGLPLTLSSGKQADDLIFRMTPVSCRENALSCRQALQRRMISENTGYSIFLPESTSSARATKCPNRWVWRWQSRWAAASSAKG